MNNGCESVVHRTKLMTYIFWGIIKRGFPVSLSMVQKTFFKRLKNVLSFAQALHFRFTRYLSITYMVMSVNWPLIVLYMSGNRAVIVRFMHSIHQSRGPWAAAGTSHHLITLCRSFSFQVTSVYAIQQFVTDAKNYKQIRRWIILIKICLASKLSNSVRLWVLSWQSWTQNFVRYIALSFINMVPLAWIFSRMTKRTATLKFWVAVGGVLFAFVFRNC